MKVLFVSHTMRGLNPYSDHATRYRCFNPRDDLRLMGHIADVCPLSDFKADHAYWYDAFVFHRNIYSKKLEKTLTLLSSLGKPFIADHDDLIFDSRNAAKSPLLLSGRSSRETEAVKFERHLKSLRLFRHVTVSTSALKKKVELSHPSASVKVIHNGLSSSWVVTGQKEHIARGELKLISYFPGSSSHSHDFRVVEDVLAEYIRENRDVVLTIVGRIEFRKKRFPADRLMILKAVPYGELSQLIRSSWVTIAPLRDTSFNRCKSGLKFFESAAFGVPVIATPIPDMLRFEGSGILFARNGGEWKHALNLLKDGEKYEQIAGTVRDYALHHCMSRRQTEKLVSLLEVLGANRRTVKRREGSRYDEGLHSDKLRESTIVSLLDKTKRRMIKLCRDPRLYCRDSKFALLRRIGTFGKEK